MTELRWWRCQNIDGPVHVTQDPRLGQQGFQGRAVCESRIVTTLDPYDTMRGESANTDPVTCSECLTLCRIGMAHLQYVLGGELDGHKMPKDFLSSAAGYMVSLQAILFTDKRQQPTSREARRDGVASGRIHSHSLTVLNTVRTYPSLTAGELGDVTGLGRVEVARRLSDAFRAGRVVKGKARVCGTQGTRQVVWRVL